MIDVLLHYRGQGSKEQRLSALPRPGDYLSGDGRLWTVTAIVFTGDIIDIYCAQVADGLAVDLQAAWAEWPSPNSGETPTGDTA